MQYFLEPEAVIFKTRFLWEENEIKSEEIKD